MLEGKGRFINQKRRTSTRTYDNFFLYVPVEVARDSSFPFRPKDVVKIKVDPDRKRVVLERE